ncbi:MAG TPA: chaperone modulator CbpM [Bacteroidales bacterium]|nr:chaperone modulator CbpM [Bacteroidales bacterium]
MEADQIAVVEFCSYHHAEESFVISLSESGLVDLVIVNDIAYIPVSQINNLEKYLRLYYDLNINLEGIETICYLQNKIEELSIELLNVKNRLRFYEDAD